MRFTILLFLATAAFAQLTVALKSGNRTKDAQWYEAKTCNQHPNSLTVSGASMLRSIEPKVQIVAATPEYRPPVHKKYLFFGPVATAPVVLYADLVIELAGAKPPEKGGCFTGLVLGKPHPEFAPVTVMIDPPYAMPARKTRRP